MFIRRFILSQASFALFAFYVCAQEAYDLEKSGDQVCKVGAQIKVKTCYQSLESANALGFIAPSNIDLVKRVQVFQTIQPIVNSVPQDAVYDLLVTSGGALFLTPAAQEIIFKNFKVLEVRNLAIGSMVTGNDLVGPEIPVVGTIRWVGFYPLLNGSIHFEGVFKPSQSVFKMDSEIQTPAEIFANLARNLLRMHMTPYLSCSTGAHSSRQYSTTRICWRHVHRWGLLG